jgi:hypothetical protein
MHGSELVNHNIIAVHSDPVEPHQWPVRRILIDGRCLYLLRYEIEVIADLLFSDYFKTTETEPAQRLGPGNRPVFSSGDREIDLLRHWELGKDPSENKINTIENMRKIFRVFIKEPLTVQTDGVRSSDKKTIGEKRLVHIEKIPVQPSGVIDSLHIDEQAERSFHNGFTAIYLTAVNNVCFNNGDVGQIQGLIDKIKDSRKISENFPQPVSDRTCKKGTQLVQVYGSRQIFLPRNGLYLPNRYNIIPVCLFTAEGIIDEIEKRLGNDKEDKKSEYLQP